MLDKIAIDNQTAASDIHGESQMMPVAIRDQTAIQTKRLIPNIIIAIGEIPSAHMAVYHKQRKTVFARVDVFGNNSLACGRYQTGLDPGGDGEGISIQVRGITNGNIIAGTGQFKAIGRDITQHDRRPGGDPNRVVEQGPGITVTGRGVAHR